MTMSDYGGKPPCKYFYNDDEDLGSRLDIYFDEVEKMVTRDYGGELSVLLIGSLAREEATWREYNGVKRLMSDIDFFIIHHGKRPDCDSLTEKLYGIAGCLESEGISRSVYIHYTLVSATRLRKSEHLLVTYDASVFGRLVAGPDPKELMPVISGKSINPHDIRNILFHKLFDLLQDYHFFASHEDREILEYRLVKSILDLQTVILYRLGFLETGTVNKNARLMSLDAYKEFRPLFDHCTRRKLNLSPDSEISIDSMTLAFLQMCTNEYNFFSSGHRERMRNLPYNFRHLLGTLKRSLEVGKFILPGRHFKRMIRSAGMGGETDFMDLAHAHYVLMGYPLRKDMESFRL
ncbi:MAG TPA: hypothetical protein PLH18_03765 [Clostridia bacterium]|nr:hypothetical protein [Clostridia bacterium]